MPAATSTAASLWISSPATNTCALSCKACTHVPEARSKHYASVFTFKDSQVPNSTVRFVFPLIVNFFVTRFDVILFKQVPMAQLGVGGGGGLSLGPDNEFHLGLRYATPPPCWTAVSVPWVHRIQSVCQWSSWPQMFTRLRTPPISSGAGRR